MVALYNTFLMSFDPNITDPSPAKLLEFVKSNKYTYQYLVPYNGSIFIKTSAPMQQVIDSYLPVITPHFFVVVDVSSSAKNGWLPGGYWNWINAAFPPALIENGS